MTKLKMIGRNASWIFSLHLFPGHLHLTRSGKHFHDDIPSDDFFLTILQVGLSCHFMQDIDPIVFRIFRRGMVFMTTATLGYI